MYRAIIFVRFIYVIKYRGSKIMTSGKYWAIKVGNVLCFQLSRGGPGGDILKNMAKKKCCTVVILCLSQKNKLK